MKRLLLFLSLLCLALSATNWPISLSGAAVVAGTPLTVPPFQVNLHSTATLTITHGKSVQICLQEFYPAPADSNWWNQSCTRWYYFRGDGQGETKAGINLRDVTYHLSIALWDEFNVGLPTGETDKVEFTFGRNDDSCATGLVWDDSKSVCREATPAPINTAVSKQYALDERNYFTFTVPPRAEAIRVSNVVLEGNNSTVPLIFQLRRIATPAAADGLHDGNSAMKIEFDYPRPGKYFLLARGTGSGEGIFNISIETCDTGDLENATLGPQCATSYITDPQPNMNMRAYQDRWTFWWLTVSQQKSVSVMVRSFDGTFFPRIYASRDQLPTMDNGNADINNCHATACSGANTINITFSGQAGEVENWFIGVTAGAGANNTQYGIWFTPICAPNCDTHGECTVSGSYIGECVCDAQWLGPDCGTQSDVNARFIVLCVIAVLLVASAIVGVVVQKVQLWRRSKNAYEQVG